MKRFKRIYILLGVLVVACIATFAALKIEERQEQIQNSEEVILSLSADAVQSLSWDYMDTTLAFHRNDDGVWLWDEDEAFPVSEDKINELLELFSAFGVSFVIEEVEDYSQYGLDEPVCTIRLETADQSYTVSLGEFSNLDEQRYVSIGDGNAYLVSTDPMDTYGISIEDMIRNDDILTYDNITSLSIRGEEEYTITYAEETADSYCDEDVYFTLKNEENLPLDTTLVDDYLGTIGGMSFTTYVSYNATEEELETYGLDDPELTVTVDYTTEGETEEAEATPGTYTLHVSRSAEEREKAATEEADEATDESSEEDEGYSAYVRVGDSQIIYEVTSTYFETLMASKYDDLRHKEVFAADFSIVTSIDVELEGNTYSLTSKPDEESETEETLFWFYGEEEIEIAGVSADLTALSAVEFTDEQPNGQQEIKLMLHLEHENASQVEIILYRYDGTNCLAVVDGESFALVARSSVVDLIEAINSIVLN